MYETTRAITPQPSRLPLLAESYTPHRFFIWAVASGGFVMAAPIANQRVDGVSGPAGPGAPGFGGPGATAGRVSEAILKLGGQPFQIEAAAAIGAGAQLGTNVSGQAVVWASGPVLGRALTATTGAGQRLWATWE